MRLHIDQKMRSQNVRARNDMIYGGLVTRSQNGRKAKCERKAGDCWQWRTDGQCSRGDSCGFRHGDDASGNASKPPKEKRASSPAPKSKATQNGAERSSG